MPKGYARLHGFSVDVADEQFLDVAKNVSGKMSSISGVQVSDPAGIELTLGMIHNRVLDPSI